MTEQTEEIRNPWPGRILLVLAVAGFGWWIFATARQQSAFHVRDYTVVQQAGSWQIQGRAVNNGPAATRVYLEVQYYPAGQRKHTLQQFILTNIPGNSEFEFVRGPLPGINPDDLDRVSVYLGTQPNPYGSM